MNSTDLSDIVKVTAAILVKDNRIIIAKRGPGDKLADKWEFPGGKVENDETPEQCLKREMKEEFDIDVSVGEFLGSIPIPFVTSKALFVKKGRKFLRFQIGTLKRVSTMFDSRRDREDITNCDIIGKNRN